MSPHGEVVSTDTPRAAHAHRAREDELLQRVAAGDADALRALYRAFERPLYTLGVRWLEDAELAEELVQEVTLRVWRRAPSFDPERGAAASWIFGIARNVASDLARARARAPLPVEDVAPERAPWDEDTAWRDFQVAMAVGELSPEQQRVVHLAYVLQFTHSEIAQALGIPLGTVKTRLYAALSRLRVRLGQLGLVEEPP